MEIHSIRGRWPEKEGFSLSRASGAQEYVLLHFLTPVRLCWNNKTVEAVPGSLILFAPGQPHAFSCDEPLCHNWAHLTGDVPQTFKQYGLVPGQLYVLHSSLAATDLFCQLEHEFIADSPYSQAAMQHLLHLLLITFARILQTPIKQLPVNSEILQQLCNIRNRMLLEPQNFSTVQEIARQMNLSVSRLHAVYKQAFGVSPVKDLILMRTDKAKLSLQQGYSVKETAANLGYENISHFIRQFQQITGETPGRYRLLFEPAALLQPTQKGPSTGDL